MPIVADSARISNTNSNSKVRIDKQNIVLQSSDDLVKTIASN